MQKEKKEEKYLLSSYRVAHVPYIVIYIGTFSV